MRPIRAFFSLILAAVTVWLGACTPMETSSEAIAQRSLDPQLVARGNVNYAIYRSLGGWNKNGYRNDELLKLATPDNVMVEISIDDQRGVLLVSGALALDFPVATGNATHPTPTGSFHIMAKEKDYHSNLYGRIYDATGKVILYDADTRVDKVPPGDTFVAASMPYWMRLTDNGVGMHVGYVPGVPASHGCVRLPDATAPEVFNLVRVGTPVLISHKVLALEP